MPDIKQESRRLSSNDSLHNSCSAVWVCKRCGNCSRHCKHGDPANFHEDLMLPCSGPCQCIDCVPPSIDELMNRELFTILPLEWEWFEALTFRGFRATAINKYVFNVTQMRGLPTEAWPERWGVQVDGELVGRSASPEEGKQLAEQHWREYIKQALEPMREAK